MNDQLKAQAIEKANSYRQMMESWAYKDLHKEAKMLESEMVEKLLLGSDTVSQEYARGLVQGLRRIFEEHVGFVLSAM